MSNDQDTPTRHRKHSQTPPATVTLKEREEVLKEELSSQSDVHTCGEEFVKLLFANEANEDQINNYLDESPLYNDRRWRLPPPSDELLEEDLYAPYVAINNDIMTRIPRCGAKGHRIAVGSHAMQLGHEEQDPTTLSSSLDISIKATGSSFQVPERKNRKAEYLGYPNIASFADVNLDKDVGEKDFQQVEIYSRQMFIQQPNRKYVRCLMVTETRFCFLHFDCSGAERSEFFDIHQKAALFVRLIMGLSSHDEAVLGFDTIIKWSHENGRKYHGAITVEQGDEAKVYTLESPEPFFKCYTVRGRGTTCWDATDEFNNHVVIKDSWRSYDRTPEHELLLEAKKLAKERGIELQGVVDMITYQDGLARTPQFRAEPQRAHDRILSRIVMPASGKPIYDFRNRLEVLYAFRDAIAGLRNLVCVELIHRDVSINNILLNEKGKKGNQGIVIDLDMAMRAERLGTSADFRTGTRMYQSVAILESCTVYEGDAPPHNHLDDPESCFYVFVHLVFLYVSPGLETTTPLIIDKWNGDDPEDVSERKQAFIHRRRNPALVSPFWGKEILALIRNLQHFFKGILDEKETWGDAVFQPDSHKSLVKILLEKVEQHYAHVLGLFDATIAEVEKVDGAAGSATAPTSVTPAPANGATIVRRSSRLRSGDKALSDATESRGKKRMSRDEENDPIDERPSKRSTPVTSLTPADDDGSVV